MSKTKTVSRPDAATGTTLIKGKEVDMVGTTSTTLKERLIDMTDVCIDFAKKGKVPYSYSNMCINGVRYGVSISLHYIEGCVYTCLMFHSLNDYIDDNIHQHCTKYVNSYLVSRGLKTNKSFALKVKRCGVTVQSAHNSTMCLYHNTAA